MGRRPRDEDPVFNRLEVWRGARGISRAELAAQVGVHYQTIGYLERGEYAPSLPLALRIAAVLGARVEDVFSLHPFNSVEAGV